MATQFEMGHKLFELTTEALTTWGTIGTLVAAIIAAIIALRQLREARELGKSADAQDSYRSYLDVCLNHPTLASPNYEKIKKNATELEQYQWFVAYLLAASEKILTVAGGDEEWISAIKLNIGYHTEYLSDKHTFKDQQFNCYSSELRDLITEETGRKAR
jgi:hypothetical protein